LKTVGWLAAALLIALGGGGAAAVADHPPGDLTRPELTAQADREVALALEPILADLDRLEEEVTALGKDARTALGELNARRVANLRDALQAGDERLVRIARLGGRIGLAFDALPYPQSSDQLGERTRARLAAIDDALRSLVPIRPAWEELETRASPAAELVVDLERHDARTFQATQAGADGRYDEAVAGLTRSMEDLDGAKRIRNLLASTTDVATLDAWIERNRAYDEALVRLYLALDASNGDVNDEVRAAYAEVQRRQRLLPPDTRALVVIMADIAEGGLNAAAIAIEEARGRLGEATERLH
jgi:hypothetical protein